MKFKYTTVKNRECYECVAVALDADIDIRINRCIMAESESGAAEKFKEIIKSKTEYIADWEIVITSKSEIVENRKHGVYAA